MHWQSEFGGRSYRRFLTNPAMLLLYPELPPEGITNMPLEKWTTLQTETYPTLRTDPRETGTPRNRTA